MKYILGAHSKVQTEFIQLETGAIQLKGVIATRRMMYLQNILKRPKEEFFKRVFGAQQLNSVKGDWIEVIKKDFNNVGINLDKTEISENKTKSNTKSQ